MLFFYILKCVFMLWISLMPPCITFHVIYNLSFLVLYRSNEAPPAAQIPPQAAGREGSTKRRPRRKRRWVNQTLSH